MSKLKTHTTDSLRTGAGLSATIFLTAGLLLSYCATGWANSSFTSVQVNHRLASELLIELKPLISEPTQIQVIDNSLVIKADKRTTQQLKGLIRQLDIPPQRLSISVLETTERLHRELPNKLAHIQDISDPDLIDAKPKHRWSTKNSRKKDRFFRIQGVADKPVTINLRKTISKTASSLILKQKNSVILPKTQHRYTLNQGFDAIARILPNHQVVIDIHPQFSDEKKVHNEFSHHQAMTTLTGPAGTWLELGHISGRKDIGTKGSSHYHTGRQQQHYIYLMVELLDY